MRHRSFVGSSKFHDFVPLGSSGYLRRAYCRLSTSLGADQRCAYQCGAAIPAHWGQNVHPFSELCARPLPLQLRYSSIYVGNSGSFTNLHISDNVEIL
ncbi:jg16489 [Pararge aegeria aegeria]|uniref:Jg16489 protein n=1 Tax=Pararge aegeria aegeria TaxID=348720 RepID=A0A8S4RKV1_9NEOP|nr:jg16489 [Pararge aegeria aegeria]